MRENDIPKIETLKKETKTNRKEIIPNLKT